MSNFFRDSSTGFKPRSNIFSKLRVKESESHNDISLTGADSSLMDDMFLQSNLQPENHSSITTINESDRKTIGANFQIGSSTPKAAKIRKTKSDGSIEEDDLEITEVRDVLFTDSTNSGDKGREEKPENNLLSLIGDKSNKSLQFTSNPTLKANDPETADTSSNDVLLEAFNNTQKICSNLKQELQRRQTENSKLKSQIQAYQIDNEKILGRFSELKKLLADLDEKSRYLSEMKHASDITLKDLKDNNEITRRKIDNYRNTIADLKLSLADFRSSKKDSDDELSKRAKEIDYLKRELNDCSGQLSEERLKNCSLVQEIGKIKIEFKEILSSDLAEKQEELNNRLISLEANMIKNLNTGIKVQLSESSLEISNNLLNEFNRCHEHSIDILESKLKNYHQESLGSLENNLTLQDSHTQQQINVLKTCMEQSIGDGHKELLIMIGKLSESFTSYRDQLTKSQEYQSRLEILQAQTSALQLQKSQALASLGVKEAQYEDLCKKFRMQEIEITKREDNEQELCDKANSLHEEIDILRSKWSKLNEENITLRANSENKIIVQGELLKSLQSENETLKQRSNQLDEMSRQAVSENSLHVDKVQRINEQLQKLNVEMVQLKAHELELEEENRSLKSEMENDRFNYEETIDEFKRLRQKVIVLEGEKQDCIREKLDLQDRIDDLQNSIKALKQRINIFQRNEYPNDEQLAFKGENVEEKSGKKNQSSLVTKLRSKQESPKAESAVGEARNEDEFDLSSSLNDDLELTNPSPIHVRSSKMKKSKGKPMKPPNISRKKLLLLDDDESTQLKHRWKKRRT